MIAKRVLDLVLTLPALIVLAPLFAGIAIWIRTDSPGPVLFRQTRIGKSGKPFTLFKFRSMVDKPQNPGVKLTVGEDPRITRSGRVLRKYKLDELPQLLNVVRGEMSLVGPRPEVPEYVAHWNASDKKIILSIPPGLTDYAAIAFINEEALLKNADDVEATYLNEIMPQKIDLYKKYVQERSIAMDIKLIYLTLLKVVRSKFH